MTGVVPDAVALTATAVGKRFGATPALIDAHLSVRQGTIHALLGGNGSGKSTLIKCLAGVYSADSGTVTIGGSTIDAASITPALARRSHLRFVHQDLGLFPQLSIAENIALAGGYPTGVGAHVRWRSLRTRVAALLEQYDIATSPDTPVGSLRPSQRSMVAIARALGDGDSESDVLLLDEPTATLSEHEASELMTALRTRADGGQTIVLVSHRFPEVRDVADDVTVFRDGRVAATDRMSAMPIERLVASMTGGALADTGSPGIVQAAGEPSLTIDHLSAGAVQDASTEVRRGEIVGLAGLGGSGRSSVLRAIFGVLPVTGGRLALDGEAYAPSSPAAAMRAGVAFVPEDRHADAAFLDLSVRENTTISVLGRYWRALRMRRGAERTATAGLLSRYGIRTRGQESSLGSLSGGNQQKVIVARWVQRDPRLLLLDEPTQGVDVVARGDIYRTIEEAAARGCAVLVASSDLEELLTLTHRVLVLRAGRIVADLPSAGTTRDEVAHLMMLDTAPIGGMRP